MTVTAAQAGPGRDAAALPQVGWDVRAILQSGERTLSWGGGESYRWELVGAEAWEGGEVLPS